MKTKLSVEVKTCVVEFNSIFCRPRDLIIPFRLFRGLDQAFGDQRNFTQNQKPNNQSETKQPIRNQTTNQKPNNQSETKQPIRNRTTNQKRKN